MKVPDHILDQWQVWSTKPEENQRRYHDSHHQWPQARDFEDCWKCGRQRAICRSKVRFENLESAYVVVDRINYPTRHKLILPYLCKWGPGLHFHNRTAKTTSERRRARKRLAKLAVSA